MRQNLRFFLCLFVAISLFSQAAKAQELINYEETWQEFLKNPLASSISKLAKPEKGHSADYLKYCLMYANSYFCANDLLNSEQMLAEVANIPQTERDKIAGFNDRYTDLRTKIAAYKSCDKLWQKFIKGTHVSLKDLQAPDVIDAKTVCEKGTLCKYFYITSMDYYCEGNLVDSRKHFEDRVQKLAEKTSFKASQVEGMVERVKLMKDVWAGMDKLDPAWKTLIETDKSPGFDTELPLIPCYTIPNMKEYILRATADMCKVGAEMLKKIQALQKTNTHPIPADVMDKIEWLEKAVALNNDGLAVLNDAWKKFLPENKPSGLEYGHEFVCDRAAEIKAYIMDGFADPCKGGKAALEKIEEIKKKYNPTLDTETTTKLKQLQARVGTEDKNVAHLNEVWADFVPDDKISGKLDIAFDYCDKAAQIKAYTIDGTVNFCDKGKQRLEDIAKLRESDNPTLADDVIKKIENLQAKQAQSDLDFADLNTAWTLFVGTDKVMTWDEGFPAKDTVVGPQIRLVDFYCDKIAQTKSWAIKGHLDPCDKGEAFLTKIDELKKSASLTYDKELDCQVSRLRSKIYQCKYWALVLKAWKITHEECERFGPASSEIMRKELNIAGQACETRVEYSQLGKIGIKYTIVAILCQKINLAQMGDPLYYKKIATWVDTEVLQKYCNTTNWRCKKDFFIYIEGHTDGYNFSGAKYDQSLDLPEGTPYTNYIKREKTGKIDTIQKTTRHITSELKSNMELGLARAWTVKQQLDFMKVPITIGAFEHPSTEKDGDFRRIEIELNITNLMLDFYEKTLNTLIEESKIGSRPKLGC